ncbi:hypothetical protein GCM10009662_39730 [Catellatospora coxensis]|uniref:DUF4259 domain-containing protein n=1 Tax=Catellatospora coxensis TaxID=310354 RepID=A0A8J3L0Z3_9ACTN|nr:hypothetical protein Cco03nite_33060 [Catellatospora coxensis]
MGTWGTGVFASDYAQDYLDELAELPEQQRLAELTRTLGIAAEEPASMRDQGLFGAIVLAAVGVVAASLPLGSDLLPDEENEFEPQGWPLSQSAPVPLVALARRALAVVGAPGSEWRNGWVSESDGIEAGRTVQWLDRVLTGEHKHDGVTGGTDQ